MLIIVFVYFFFVLVCNVSSVFVNNLFCNSNKNEKKKKKNVHIDNLYLR